MTFSAVLSALGLAPKTIDQAKGSLASAAQTLESVSALFTTAGLSLEQMLTAGPESLKAHLASLSAKDGELAAALAKVTALEAQAVTDAAKILGEAAKVTAANARADALIAALAPVGIKADTKTEEFSALLTKHVKEQAAVVLSGTGHKPVSEVTTTLPAAGAVAIDPKLTGLAQTQAIFQARADAKRK